MQTGRARTAVRSAAKRVIERAGFEVRATQPGVGIGRGTQRGSLRHLAGLGLAPTTVLDIGAADGTPALYEVFPSAHHVLVEPLEEFAAALRVRAERLAHADVIIAAAGATAGTITLNVHPDLVGSSVLRENEDSDVNGVEREVEQVTLDELVERFGTHGPYLVKVDTQGSELEVLRGGVSRVLPDTEAVLLEVSLFQFFDRGPQIVEVFDWMASHGLVPYDITDAQYRLLDGAMSQVDVVFVREDGRFRQSHQYATTAQRQAQTDRLRSWAAH